MECGFETLAARVGSAEFHIAGDYAFEICLLGLEVCQSGVSWLVYCIGNVRSFKPTSSRPWTANHRLPGDQSAVAEVDPRHPKALDGLAV